MHESVLQRAFKEARLNTGGFKHAGCHTLRDSFFLALAFLILTFLD